MGSWYNNPMAINYNELEKALADMKPRQRLYELVKAEMQRRGHWKLLKRGFHVTEDK
jgi:hypothetical protein